VYISQTVLQLAVIVQDVSAEVLSTVIQQFEITCLIDVSNIVTMPKRQYQKRIMPENGLYPSFSLKEINAVNEAADEFWEIPQTFTISLLLHCQDKQTCF